MTTNNISYDKLTSDLLWHINLGKRFMLWMTFLIVALIVCLYAYTQQLKIGLGVTGLRDYISWGLYIANFVFFVATSLIGMLISAVLGLIGIKWITPITRIAETIAVAFSAVAGLVIISDMGRPDRLAYVFIYGRFQSPIFWDVSVVVTYFFVSLLLLFLPLIPDIAVCNKKLENIPSWLKKSYRILSLNWAGMAKQHKIIQRSLRICILLIIPLALAIHTVTSWLFAVNSRAGWDSSNFGAYFVTGAFVTGTAAVIIAMYFFQKNYKLQNYLTDMHFNKMGKLLVLVCLIYFYFNLNEFLVPGYKLKTAEAIFLHTIFKGDYSVLFWFVQLGGLIIPIILLFFKKMRKPLPIMIISIFVFVGAWFKRFIIVVPTETHPFLPIQHVPPKFMYYRPTLIETAVTLASFIIVLIIITLISKFFPVIPLCETAREKGIENTECV